jgi:hypothetical protein
MHDEIAHQGIIDRSLRCAFPGIIGLFVIRINAYDVKIINILELDAVQAFQFAAEYQM